MGRYFMLVNGEVVAEPDYPKWAAWYGNHYGESEFVARSETRHGIVVTRFLAMDMSLAQADEPQVFETRVKGGWFDDTWQRYTTLGEAREGHEAWVTRVRQAEEEEDFPPHGIHW